MTQPSSASGTRAYVIGCDAKSDIRVFSGITYHLANQGVQDGLLTGMVNLYPRGIGAWQVYARAGWWKLSGGLRRRQGFKFTDAFLDGIWKRRLPALQGSTVINNFQVFGSYFLRSHEAFGVLPYSYIDGTLGEYFRDYRAFDAAGVRTAIRQAIAVEREGYASCRKIVVMSKRTAEYIACYYNVPQYKIHILPPGANIPEHLLEARDSRPLRRHKPGGKTLIVGFIGLYPERKGLPIIADGVQLLRRAGYDIRLHIIGKCPPEISKRDGVTHFGLIDKRVDIDRFIEIIRNVDVGCMLSRAETAGIALRVLANGRPGHDHGRWRHSRHRGPRRWAAVFAGDYRERSSRISCSDHRRTGSADRPSGTGLAAPTLRELESCRYELKGILHQ